MSETDSMENYSGRKYGKRFPMMFKGTGQNGQILKEDLRNWSRKLHNQIPPNLYEKSKVPKKTIFIGYLMFILGTIFLLLSGMQTMKEKSIDETMLKLLAGLIIFIPGFWVVIYSLLI